MQKGKGEAASQSFYGEVQQRDCGQRGTVARDLGYFKNYVGKGIGLGLKRLWEAQAHTPVFSHHRQSMTRNPQNHHCSLGIVMGYPTQGMLTWLEKGSKGADQGQSSTMHKVQCKSSTQSISTFLTSTHVPLAHCSRLVL